MNLTNKENLVGDWRLFLGSLRDYSGQENHATPTSTRWQNGHLKGMLFNSSGRLDVSDDSSLQVTSLTLMPYSKTGFRTPTATEYVFAKKDGGGTNIIMYWDATNVYLNDGGTTSQLALDVTGANSIAVTCVSGGKPKFYKDSVYQGEGNNVLTITVNDAPVKIGSDESNANQLQSSLSGLFYWNTNINDESVASNHELIMTTITPIYPKRNFVYSSRINPKASGLVAAYDMKNIGGNIVDKTGNGSNGVITGAVQKRGYGGLESLELNGTNGYMDVGDTSQTIKTIELLVNIKGNNKLVDFDGGTHTLEVSGGSVSAGGWSSPTYYVDNAATAVSANGWRHIVVTSATGFAVDNLDIGRVGATYGSEEYVFVSMYSDEKSSAWVASQYNKYAKLPFFLDDFLDYNESIANVTAGFLENSNWEIITGTWKISRRTDQPSGHQIECIGNGKLRYKGLLDADDMYTKEFELLSGTPTLTKNSTNVEIDALATEKVGKVHLSYGTY